MLSIYGILLFFMIFIWDYSFTVKIRKDVYQFEYTGLLWVMLDMWSINRYGSNDEPLRWIEFKRRD
jgi:hypothetical protein